MLLPSNAPASSPPRDAPTTRGLEHPTGEQVFLPVSPKFLTTSQPIPFRVLARLASTQLRVYCREDRSMTLPKRAEMRACPPGERLYVPASQAPLLVRFCENQLDALMADASLKTEGQSDALHSLLTLQLEQLFQSPSGLGIFRVNETAQRLVHLADRDPDALGHMADLNKHVYSMHGHSVNVGVYGLALAREVFGLSEKRDWVAMATAFLVHDIGRSKVHPDIRRKAGALEEFEWWEMRRHPAYGARILERARVEMPVAAAVVFQHHERPDGLGYPHGLQASFIHPCARICSVADAFDALTTTRSFRRAVAPAEALRVMRAESGTQFDADVFRAFVGLVGRNFRARR